MNESAKSAIRAVLNTLDQLTVSGRDNLDMLLASMMTLEKLLKEEERNGRVLDDN